MHALDFGGGWRMALHEYTIGGKGVWLTAKAGVEQIYNDSPTIISYIYDYLKFLWRKVAMYFNLPNDQNAELLSL